MNIDLLALVRGAETVSKYCCCRPERPRFNRQIRGTTLCLVIQLDTISIGKTAGGVTEPCIAIAVIILIVLWLPSRLQRPVIDSSPSEHASPSAHATHTDNRSSDDIISIVEPLNDGAAIEKTFRSVFAIMSPK